MNPEPHPFPTLTTDRLILRQLTKYDCQEVLFLRSDREVNKYIKRPVPKDISDAEAFVNNITMGIENSENLYWCITLKNNPKMIGSICLWNFSPDRSKAEVGYELDPAIQNKGIMTEALRCVLNFSFETLGLAEIEAFTHYQNENSKKLLLKNNFTCIVDRKDKDDADNIVFLIKSAAAKANS